MSDVINNINEILFLHKQLNYELSMKGGSKDILNFKEEVEKNKPYFTLVFSITTIIILYVVFSKLIDKEQKFYMLGGESLTDKIEDKVDQLYEKADKMTYKIELKLNMVILKVKLFFSIYGTKIILIIVLICLLIFISLNFILDRKLYLPCYGCSESTVLYKCIPGTGKGSISCTIYTQILDKLEKFIGSIKYIKYIIKKFTNAIENTINTIKSLIEKFKLLKIKLFGINFADILDALSSFLKPIKIPDKWGFNLGVLLICPHNGGTGLGCIYDKNGKLRTTDKHKYNDCHGSADKTGFLYIFWKMIRIILEKEPFPPLKWPQFGGDDHFVSKDTYEKQLESEVKFKNKNLEEQWKKEENKLSNINNTKIDETDYESNLSNLNSGVSKTESENSKKLDKLNIDLKNKELKKKEQRARDIELRRKMIEKEKNFKIKDIQKILKLIETKNKENKNIDIQINNLNKNRNKDASKTEIQNLKNNLDYLTQKQNNIKKDIKRLLVIYKKLDKEKGAIADKNDKNAAYAALLEALMKVEINPLKWIASLFNLIIYAINKSIHYGVVLPIKTLIKLIIKLVSKLIDSVVSQLKKLIKFVMKPLQNVSKIITSMNLNFLRAFKIIFDIGPLTMILFYFYNKIRKMLIIFKSFMVIMVVVMVVVSILLVCPIIGSFHQFYKMYRFILDNVFMLYEDITLHYIEQLKKNALEAKSAVIEEVIKQLQIIINQFLNFSIGNPLEDPSTLIYIIITVVVIVGGIIFSSTFTKYKNNFMNEFITNNTTHIYNKITKKYKPESEDFTNTLFTSRHNESLQTGGRKKNNKNKKNNK